LNSENYERKRYIKKSKIRDILGHTFDYGGDVRLFRWLGDIPVYQLIPVLLFWGFIAVGVGQLSFYLITGDRSYIEKGNTLSINYSDWQEMTSTNNMEKQFVGSVHSGDLVQIINASTEWVIGLQTPDGKTYEETYSAERGIEMPINADGNLFFRLLNNGKLKYKVIPSEQTEQKD